MSDNSERSSGRGGAARWAAVSTTFDLDDRYLATDSDRVRLAALIRLMKAKVHGPAWPAGAWAALLGEYRDTLDDLVRLDFLVDDGEGRLTVPDDEWATLTHARIDPTGAKRAREYRQQRAAGTSDDWSDGLTEAEYHRRIEESRASRG